VSVDPPHGVQVQRVTTAQQMQRAMTEAAGKADVVLMAAAVADYRPARPSAQKIKRSGESLTVTFEPNPDILAGLGAAKRAAQTLVGFARDPRQRGQRSAKLTAGADTILC
jgi:phosphopantothenoylcysteine decarboxylase/phosphopantothenate--cysteine ligase